MRDCLAGIARLDYPRGEFEVVVIDDGSCEPPEEEVRDVAHVLNIRLLVASPNAGPAKARNMGASSACGSYLVLIDDDCIPTPELLRAFDEKLAQFPRALVGGALRNGAPDSLCAEASQQLVNFLYRYFNSDHANARWFMSANIACPRDEFLRIGGFGSDFPLAAAEDRDFCDRWREAGNQLVFAPRALVSHVRPMSLQSYWNQHRTYGRGAHHLHRARVRRRVGLPSMEPLSFYFKLLCSPIQDANWWQVPPLVALLFLSQVAYAIGYYPERKRSPIPTEPALPSDSQLSSPPHVALTQHSPTAVDSRSN